MFVPQEEVTLKRSLSLAWSQRSLCQDLWPLPSPFQRAAADSKNLENRMKEMDENLATQHRQTVKEALKNVRTLTPRPTLVSLGVPFAALKTYQFFWYFTLQSVFYIQYEFGDKVLYFFCWDCKESGQETRTFLLQWWGCDYYFKYISNNACFCNKYNFFKNKFVQKNSLG